MATTTGKRLENIAINADSREAANAENNGCPDTIPSAVFPAKPDSVFSGECVKAKQLVVSSNCVTKSFTKSDVLCGRGNIVNQHEGNRRFRAWVESRRVAYSLAESIKRKGEIVQEVRMLVENQLPPGRFLEKQPSTSKIITWKECPLERIKSKISQALREGAPKIRVKHIGRRSVPSSKIRQQMESAGISYEHLAALDKAKAEEAQKRSILAEGVKKHPVLLEKEAQTRRSIVAEEAKKRCSVVAVKSTGSLKKSRAVKNLETGPQSKDQSPATFGMATPAGHPNALVPPAEFKRSASFTMWDVDPAAEAAATDPFDDPFGDDVEEATIFGRNAHIPQSQKQHSPDTSASLRTLKEKDVLVKASVAQKLKGEASHVDLGCCESSMATATATKNQIAVNEMFDV